jgi:hypothetical protein
MRRVPQGNRVGLFGFSDWLPFEESICRHKAPARLIGAAKRGHRLNRLAPSVDTPPRDLRVIRPEGDQAPAKHPKDPTAALGMEPNDRQVLAG